MLSSTTIIIVQACYSTFYIFFSRDFFAGQFKKVSNTTVNGMDNVSSTRTQETSASSADLTNASLWEWPPIVSYSKNILLFIVCSTYLVYPWKMALRSNKDKACPSESHVKLSWHNKLEIIDVFLVVLNEKQRVAKRKLIEENRERRKKESLPNCSTSLPSCSRSDSSSVASSSEGNLLSEADQVLISAVVQAFEKSATSAAESPVSQLK